MEKSMQTTEQSVEKMDSAPAVSPYMDIYESDNEIVMIADLPGISQENLDLQFENNEISIKGIQSPVDEVWKPRFMERHPVHFERSFTLPSGLDIKNISAELDSGVLTITLPKSESEKPHTITINKR